jgi:polar amino acid transport system permease protein
VSDKIEFDRLAQFIETFFRPDLIREYSGAIGHGIIITCEIAFLVVITGIATGLFLAIIRAYNIKILNILIIISVDILRSLPPLVLILLFYFGLPLLGLNMSSFIVLWLVLSFVLAAFAEEIFWAGILSVRQGQWEAARSTGLSFGQSLIYIVIPQAIKITIAPLTNRTIAITKNTALGTVIGVSEILNQASTAQSFSGNATPLMMGALAYIFLFVPVVIIGRWIETRFSWKRA